MSSSLTVDGGTLAYETSGPTGPLLVLAHGMGDSRAAYRFLTPLLVSAGYRVAAVDVRGCGASSVDWPSYTRTDIANDLLALVDHLGGPAVLVGHSISGGAATIAAAASPSLITAVVEVAPFTRKQKVALADLRVSRFRRGMLPLVGAGVFGSTRLWRAYLDVAYPGLKPGDWDERLDQIEGNLRERGRMKALQRMGRSTPADADAQLAKVSSPVLVVQGTLDPDWASPQAEGEGIVAALPSGLAHLTMIAGAGHYPHVQFPEQTADAILAFLASTGA